MSEYPWLNRIERMGSSRWEPLCIGVSVAWWAVASINLIIDIGRWARR